MLEVYVLKGCMFHHKCSLLQRCGHHSVLRFSIVYAIAAAPDATANAATPPSSAAILFSNTSSVGFVSLP